MNNESNSEENMFSILRALPPWIIALALVGILILGYMSYKSGTPFEFTSSRIGFKVPPKCKPNACIRTDGLYGTVKLLPALTADMKTHGWEPENPVAVLPGIPTHSRKSTSAATYYAAATWACD